MRKADKRKRGIERAAYYLEEERQLGLRAQKLDHQIRAERAAEKAKNANKKKAPKVINRIAERFNEDQYKEQSNA
jgi:hypothetical protein